MIRWMRIFGATRSPDSSKKNYSIVSAAILTLEDKAGEDRAKARGDRLLPSVAVPDVTHDIPS